MVRLFGKPIFHTKKFLLVTLKDTSEDFIRKVQIIEEYLTEYVCNYVYVIMN